MVNDSLFGYLSSMLYIIKGKPGSDSRLCGAAPGLQMSYGGFCPLTLMALFATLQPLTLGNDTFHNDYYMKCYRCKIGNGRGVVVFV